MRWTVVALCVSWMMMAPSLSRGELVRVQSPDEKLVVTVDTQGAGPGAEAGAGAVAGSRLTWRIDWDSKPVMLESPLGFTLDGAAGVAAGFTLEKVHATASDTSWKTVVGERSTVRDNYRQATIVLSHPDPKVGRLELVVRAYNEGAAVRYVLPALEGAEGGQGVKIASEQTEFRFPAGTQGWAVSSAQGVYARKPLDKLGKASDRPLTVELPAGRFAAVGEAGMMNFARMYLASGPVAKDSAGVISHLAGPVELPRPVTWPWRFVMVAARPGDLIQNNHLLLNLSEPSRLTDTSWIKPGKVIREITLSTDGARATVDFAAAQNLQYILFDAGWYGHEYDDKADATTVTVDPKRNPKGDLDLPAAIAYARSKNVGVILYVNRRALERQLDDLLPLYRSWGVSGIKFGFVNVGPQPWTRWLHQSIAKSAQYQMVINVHDEYRTTGNERTYPNLLTVEGIAGNETKPTATLNTIQPFTRYLAGPADATICYYHQPIKTTHGHQLALAVVFYSPLQHLYWYDKPAAYQGEPEIKFFRDVPTVWDETRVIDGAIGQFITTARRTGPEWFVGTINSDEPRSVTIPLSFLPPGQLFEAEVYEDGGQGAHPRTQVSIRKLSVSSQSVIEATLKPAGGQAIRLSPLKLDRHPN
jgi:alpha-glucosidase